MQAFTRPPDQKPARFDPRVLRDVEQAALFLIERIETDGWKVWSWNYLREHARCKSGAKFTNTDSPELYRAAAGAQSRTRQAHRQGRARARRATGHVLRAAP
jgi:hypothetical protein